MNSRQVPLAFDHIAWPANPGREAARPGTYSSFTTTSLPVLLAMVTRLPSTVIVETW